MKPDLSVVVPAYNESASMTKLFDAATAYVEDIDFSVEFVFVDDGSSDTTFADLCRRPIPGARVKVVKLSRNYGAHPAIRAGISQASADRVMIYSMDMPEPIEDIGRFYHELMDGWEIVYSERLGYRGSWGSRRFGKMINRYIEPSYPSGGLIGVAFGKKVKDQLNRSPEKNSSIFFQIFQLGFSRKGIPVEYNERECGESKWTLRKKVKLFIDSFVMFSYMPIRAISGIGVAMAFIGLVWALLIIIFKLARIVDFAAGWPTMMSILLIGFGITNISLGIIAEYLVRTLDSTRGRPAFIIDEVVEEDR